VTSTDRAKGEKLFAFQTSRPNTIL